MKVLKRVVSLMVVFCMVIGLAFPGGLVKKADAAVKKKGFTSYEQSVRLQKDARDAWTEQVATYVRPDGYRLTRPMLVSVAAWATIPAGTKVGTVTFDGTIYRQDKSEVGDFEGYDVYDDEMDYRVIVAPLPDPIKVTAYRKNLEGQTVTNGTYSVYAASELLTIDFGGACRFGTTMTSGMMANNPNQPEGGIYIHSYGPSANSNGRSEWSIYVGLPYSISHSINFGQDFCIVTDTTNTGLYSYGSKYDYKKWSGAQHICTSDRGRVIFGKTVQYGACAWYTADKTYSLTFAGTYSITLCRKADMIVTEMPTNATTSYTYRRNLSWPLN